MKKFNLKLNKTKTLILVGIITLLLFVGGATYAYFAFAQADSAQANMEIISNTVDNLMFNIEKEIYINANLNNFGEGMSDLHDDTDATATLIPNNYDNEATAMYNIYLIIESNDLEYTTNNQTPELLLNVTDPNGKRLENITGLVHYDNGFDITTRTGGFLIASDYVITAQDLAEIQTWNVEITLVNLDSNQNANMNKTFSAKLYLTQEKMSSYNPVQITNIEATQTYNSIDTTLNLSNGTADVEKYYFGIEESNSAQAYINNNNNGIVRLNNKIMASADTVEYIESDTPNYKFTNLKENTEYTIYSYVEDVNGIKSNTYETKVVTNEYRLPSVGEVTYSVTLDSITLTVNNSTSGDGTITKYMYSKDNGESWEESDSNTYTFTNLTDTTEYKIKIKVVDSNERESTEYYKAISTETYILPSISNVEYETTYNSITLTPSGTAGTNTIDHYKYSIDNGAYQTSNVFNGLNENTEYTINVKAIDSEGRESNAYELKVTTDTYEVPVISKVTTSSTTNSITINVDATNGDGAISKYMYSRDNGSNWSESTSNSYTFSNLTSNTTFYVQVKVVDNNNRESAVSNATIKTQYINPVVNSVSASNITSNSVRLTINATAGSNSIATYYYSSNNGSSYVSSSSNTYTFNNLSAGTTYNFRVYVVDSLGVKSNEATTHTTTENNSLADYIKGLYTSQGTNDLYYHRSSLANSAGDNSYRYAGANPNNYVCFGSDASRCPSANLYRIIGVFGSEVKLIKSTSYGNYYWSGSSSNTSNTWSSSTLNTSTLNGTYLNNLGSAWSNLIATHSWKVGGMERDNSATAKQYYNTEVGSSSSSTTYSAKIGLMYVSDYGFAASNSYWTEALYDYDNSTLRSNNWMYLGSSEWTISRSSDYLNNAFSVNDTGYVRDYIVLSNDAVRPVFYLTSSTEYLSGSGTESDPYRIN